MPNTDSNGVPIHHEVIGEGQPIVLVHGFSSSFDRDWRGSGWIEFLVGEKRQVIGLDCRGHGKSGKPHSPESYAGNQVPDDVLAVMDAAGVGRADIMGYSMGALVALNLVSRHAERFTSAVVGGAGLPTPTFDPERRAALAEALEADGLPALAALQRSERTQADQAALRRLDLPLLVVVGDKDEVLPSARELAAAVPGAELLTVAGEDHQSALAAPGFKQAVRRFLRARRGTATP